MAEVSIDDILEEVFVRLSVEDLIRCKRVCKSWYFIISDQRFIKFHLLNNVTKNANRNNNDNGFGDTRIYSFSENHYQHPSNYNEGCHIVGSCDGLVCLTRYNVGVLVVNPCAREARKLTSPQVTNKTHQASQYCWGFGYDSSLDDYKVVLGFMEAPYKTCFQVLTLKSDIWKSVGNLDYCCESSSCRDAIFYSGGLHWIMTDKQKDKHIMSFDLCKEEFKEIPLPFMISPGLLRLGMIKGGQMCCFDSTFSIWVMKNYTSVEHCWEQIYESGDLWYDFCREADYMLPHSFFGGWPPMGLSAYYSEELTFPVYVQSLVSPHGKYRRLINIKRQSPVVSTGRIVKRQMQTLESLKS